MPRRAWTLKLTWVPAMNPSASGFEALASRQGLLAADSAAENAAFDRRMLFVEQPHLDLIVLPIVGIIRAAAPFLAVRGQAGENGQPDQRAHAFGFVAIVDVDFGPPVGVDRFGEPDNGSAEGLAAGGDANFRIGMLGHPHAVDAGANRSGRQCARPDRA